MQNQYAICMWNLKMLDVVARQLTERRKKRIMMPRTWEENSTVVSTTFCNRTAERTRTNSGQPSFAVCYLVKFSLRPKEDAAYYYCNGMPVVLDTAVESIQYRMFRQKCDCVSHGFLKTKFRLLAIVFLIKNTVLIDFKKQWASPIK